ncbi:cytochrome P450 [Dothidotthia symphoricarpi CBS 119687]|uniref:Cytochrome P450 n=1 Tax=Dothidotthia symphoricarpi CBS 119687 TaxID=1392245 RepID=A0A6A6AK22_9PLEO|nr:cytochrome P450 [Dothidotthia symphoricarpi CBS 119687]KAF2131445.1 cytochrome P450 [Dothidotthia symphoricarpi CBS 119687]
MDPFPAVVFVFAPLSAIILHEFVLRRVEVDHLSLPIIVISSSVYWLLVYKTSFLTATVVTAAFWLPLFLYIGAYRAFFHPLRDYPGPKWAKLSKWWALKQTWESHFHGFEVQQQLQRDYGDYVRTGPRELSIFDPAAIQPILGFQSKTRKGPFYSIMEKSLHLNRDKAFHRQRRKIWDNGMKTSLSDFAPRVEEFTEQLLERIRAANRKPVPLMRYMVDYSYDVMAELAFGKPMGFTKGDSSDVADGIVQTFTDGLQIMGLLMQIPWMFNALGALTELAGPMKVWKDWSVSQMNARIARKEGPPDFITHLINGTPDSPAGRELLYGESRLIISAGSETTSTALTFAFINLATHPEYMRAVRKEFRDTTADTDCQCSRPLLDAVIHESMRLRPSVFFASQRVTPPEGMSINGHFIPGNMIISMPPFAMNRDARNFVDPDEFIPERWTTKPELVLNKSAYNPFSTGPYNCVGKALAMMELRSVLGRVISEFDVVLPTDFDSAKYWEGVKDHFTAGPPKQMVEFVKAETKQWISVD